MFRDDVQLARALRVLLGTLQLEDLWTYDGPTDRAAVLYEGGGGALKQDEWVLLCVVFSFWNGDGGLMFDHVLGALDRGVTEALCSLMVAATRGPEAIDAWIACPWSRRVHLPGIHCASEACDRQPDVHVRPYLYRRLSFFPFCSCSCNDCKKAREGEPFDDDGDAWRRRVARRGRGRGLRARHRPVDAAARPRDTPGRR
jgi:hypothetical protein